MSTITRCNHKDGAFTCSLASGHKGPHYGHLGSAESGDTSPSGHNQPSFLFAWTQNDVQATLQRLHDTEAAHGQELAEVVSELRTSSRFWQLYSRYVDAVESAERAGGGDREHHVLLAFVARMFVAGSLREFPVFDEDRLGGAQ